MKTNSHGGKKKPHLKDPDAQHFEEGKKIKRKP